MDLDAGSFFSTILQSLKGKWNTIWGHVTLDHLVDLAYKLWKTIFY